MVRKLLNNYRENTAAVHAVMLFFFYGIGINLLFPALTYASCEGISGPAHFSLYKNRQATFNSTANADYEQKYDIEWFIGKKSMGSIAKSGGESFILVGSSLSSQGFSVTGSYKKNGHWFTSHYKIFPDHEGGIQIRFEDGTCDNSFETSPDLKVIIRIN